MKKNFKVGDKVWFWEPPSWSMAGIVLEVDSHPFEYDMLRIVQTDSVGKREVWISEKNVESQDKPYDPAIAKERGE